MKTSMERYVRQLPVVGKRGQEIIAQTSLSVVGMGGHGSIFALLACMVGFRSFRLVDFDRLETSNLHRWFLGGLRDVGKFKVQVAKKRLQEFNSSIRCETFVADVTKRRVLSEIITSDVIVSCVDRVRPRKVLHKACLEKRKLLLDLGAGVRLHGKALAGLGSRASLQVHGETCLNCMYLDDEPMRHARASFVTSNVVAAAVGLNMLLNRLIGLGEKKNQVAFDGLKQEMMSFYATPRQGCPYCGGKSN